ncbi:hypothetical protein Tco_0732459 [Tanacetum coccineum]
MVVWNAKAKTHVDLGTYPSSEESVKRTLFATHIAGGLYGNRAGLKIGKNRKAKLAVGLGTIAIDYFLDLSASAAAILFFDLLFLALSCVGSEETPLSSDVE